jgi:hypothetical protein
MKPTFQDKIEACKLASIEQIKKLKDFKSKTEERIIFDLFFSESKYKGQDSFLELWNCYGLSDANLNWLDVKFQSNVTLFHSKHHLMEKWFEIVFHKKIAFKPFFDIEIEQHNRLRENANRNGIKHLVLIVDFDKIAKTIDHHFSTISTSKLNINTVNVATITPPAKIDEELVKTMLSVSPIEISSNSKLKNWIYLITNTENQTLTERLTYLNILANSLKEAIDTFDHVLDRAYLNGLYSQLLKWMHETLDIVEWLCDANYEKLPTALLKEFKTCKCLHMWKSRIN